MNILVTGATQGIGKAIALKLAQDSDLLRIMKKNALESAKRFDLPEIVPIYERLYESAYASRHQNQD